MRVLLRNCDQSGSLSKALVPRGMPKTRNGTEKLVCATKALPVLPGRGSNGQCQRLEARPQLECAAVRSNKRPFEKAFDTSQDFTRALNSKYVARFQGPLARRPAAKQ